MLIVPGIIRMNRSACVCLCVCVQVNEGVSGLVENCVSGRWSELSAALLEVMQRYMGQFQLLSEIQGLRSR